MHSGNCAAETAGFQTGGNRGIAGHHRGSRSVTPLSSAAERSAMDEQRDVINSLIDRSSLGTPGAKLLRGRTPASVVDTILKRAAQSRSGANETGHGEEPGKTSVALGADGGLLRTQTAHEDAAVAASTSAEAGLGVSDG